MTIIVAMSENGCIGIDNTIPWKLSDDMKNFKEETIGNIVVMGRKTYESIGKPLPNRINIVISRNPDFKPEGVIVVDSPKTARSKTWEVSRANNHQKKVYIIGGAEIYKDYLPYINRMIVTRVKTNIDGDTFFPELERKWRIDSKKSFFKNENNEYDFEILELYHALLTPNISYDNYPYELFN